MSENPINPPPERKIERTVAPKNIVAHLRSVEREVRIDDPRIGAIHGTSLEAIQYLIRNGVLHGRSFPMTHYQIGDISVFPTSQLADVRRRFISDDDYTEALARTGGDPRTRGVDYAESVTDKHRLLTILGFPSTTTTDQAVSDLLFNNDPTYFLAHGKTQEEIDQARDNIFNMRERGFLLGFSPDIQYDPEISFTEGDPHEGDLNLRTGNKGLSYRYISTIEPLGEIERKFLKNYQA